MSSTAAAAPILRFGDFELDMQSGELRNKDRTMRLPEQPFRILILLLERPGEVVTREELRTRLWTPDTFVDFETGLNSAMRKLRDALGDSADRPTVIETLPRRGYRLVAPIVPAAALETSPDPQRVRFSGLKWAWAAGLALVILVGFIASVQWRLSPREPIAQGSPPRIESIAVLPLENLSGDPEQEYFADGMTDALITDLAQIQGLRVISRTSVTSYKTERKRLPQIARELNVDAVVEGTVMRSGSKVRISAQLIHASSDRHLWAKSYERDLGDVFPLQGELAQAIADAVEVNVAPKVRARLQSAPRLNRDAYDAFFKGMVAAARQNPEGFAKAIKDFEELVTIQPDFALAHVWLARCRYQYNFFGPLAPRDFMPKVEAAARKGLEADPSLAEGHRVLGNVLYRFHWNWPAAEAEFRRALELSPSDAAAHRAYSMFLSARGRVDEAIAQREMARKVDPKFADSNLDEPSRTSADFERAAAAYRSEVERNPTPRGYFQLGSALVMNGRLSEGIAALEASSPQKYTRQLGYLGYAYGAAGHSKKARAILADLIDRSRQGYVSSFVIALVHMGLNENEFAIERLERAYDERAFELSHLNVTPAFDPLRGEPRFVELVKRLGLPAATNG
ncbi:MAG TPA: winged helix-turn-helix domain-containing protein [Thermoanaerobaculia bacterium]|jgi:TolB-like protein/DNA-binding winged helix-turn-helix (wHTH) protein/Tfp pilus assembly protein PilF|nr:winged helix-turn-helix domain-containing protein [Thermoanaerobaculia bacterium]